MTGQVTPNKPVYVSSHPINTKTWNALWRPHNFVRTLIQIPILKHGIAAVRRSYITADDKMYELRIKDLKKQYSVDTLNAVSIYFWQYIILKNVKCA